MTMKRNLFFIILFILTAISALAQTDKVIRMDSITNRIIDQVILCPKEKLYVHLDKPTYVSGEKIWFRVWLADAVLHKQVSEQIVFVELINPMDSVVYRSIIKQNLGSLNGNIPLNLNLPEGYYTFCAYTENYKSNGTESVFKKQINILSPFGSNLKSEIKFSFKTEDDLIAETTITDLQTNNKINPDFLKIRIEKQPLRIVKSSKNSDYVFSFRLPQNNINRTLLMEFKSYRKFFSIPFPNNDYEVTFYPEGGYLLQGANCKVAFKSLNSGGYPENVTGTIVDNYNKNVTDFSIQHDGMGQFSFVPKEGLIYYAVCKNENGKEKRFVLPEAEKEAYSLKAEFVQDKINLSVLYSENINQQSNLYLLLQTRGIVHYFSKWDQNYYTISLTMSNFPSGVMQAILFDSKLNPLSERLIFCNNDDQANVEFNTELKNYSSRQLVNTEFKITDFKGLPLEGSFSISITDDKDILIDSTATILTNLLLSSEIKGFIKNPAYYFQKSNPEAKQDLDLLMLTNGWRRYNIPKIIHGELEHPILKAYQGLPISGEVRTLFSNKPVKKGKVSILSWQTNYFNETETDSTGRFTFNGIEYPDSTVFVVQALNKKNNNGVELFLDNDSFPSIPVIPEVTCIETESESKKEELINENLKHYVNKSETRYSLDMGISIINLPDVIVTANAQPGKEYNYSFYMPPTGLNVITDDKINFSQYQNVSDILIHIPFVHTEGGKVIIDRMNYYLNGVNAAVLIVDDLIMTDYDIDMIDPSIIERIGVLKGAQASILGGDGAGGAIVITTKKGMAIKNNSPKYNIKKISPLGFQNPVEFYAPRYETDFERNNPNPDLRTTIYWSPDVTVSSSGEASIGFFTADASTTYSVIIEGISSDGSIIHSINKISRK
jgi:hypothetical protein